MKRDIELPKKSDGELIHAYLNGDEKAFETLYYRYRQPLFGFLNNLLRDDCSEVEDIFSLTWLRVVDKLPLYHDEGKFSAWLFRLARNIYFDRWRQERPDKFISLDEDEEIEEKFVTEISPDRVLNDSELGQLIQAALNQLPPEQREVFLLRDEEISFRDIAEIQHCSIGTVLSRMRYALSTLRKILSPVYSGKS